MTRKDDPNSIFAGSDGSVWQSKIIQLEETLCHDQRTISELNEVVIRLSNEVESLRKQLQAFDARFQWLSENSVVGENLPHEKPPHY